MGDFYLFILLNVNLERKANKNMFRLILCFESKISFILANDYGM